MAESSNTQTQTTAASPHEIRESLHEAVVNDLLGPAEGSEEIIVPNPKGIRSVRDRYLVGKLAPRNVPPDAAEQEEMSGEATTSSGDGIPEDGGVGRESLVPSSFGMTFCVDAASESLVLLVSWGHYQKIPSVLHMTEEGKPKLVWRRRPAGGQLTL